MPKKIELLTVSLDPKPGALMQVCAAFREAKVDLWACWAYEMGPTQAQAHFYARDLNRAKEVLTKLGKAPKTESACYATDTDRLGVYCDLLKKIADANINLGATDAFSIDGKFATIFFVEQDQIPKLCKALGC